MPAHIATIHLPKPNDYVEAVRAAGAEPVLIDWRTADGAAALDGVHGVLLTGGADVDPRLYGESPHGTYEPADKGRDGFEIEIVRLALERDLPVLAICRGVQVLNVACGGTLWQDLPSQIGHDVAHQVTGPRHTPAHDVHVVEGSRLDSILSPRMSAAARRVPVNSRHHQAIKQVAPGFMVTAKADDGVIEAVERPDAAFCVGVQWHPENFWRTGEFLPLFRALAEARPS
jgi:putative glutamine amidotransferase